MAINIYVKGKKEEKFKAGNLNSSTVHLASIDFAT